MVKLYSLLALIVFCMFLAMPFASAGILISQPKTSYSLGDEMKIDVTLDSLKAGYLDVNLDCGNTSMNIYHNVPEEKTVSIKRLLTPEYINSLYGSCNVVAVYGSDSQTGPLMDISNQVDITMTSDAPTTRAGESVELKGTAYKSNNQLLGLSGGYDGFVEASIGELNGSMQASGIVKDGRFSLTIDVPEETHSGSKSLRLKVYDKDSSGNLMNIGELVSQLTVIQKPARISIALDKTNVTPGDSITIVPTLVDFSGDNMDSQILMKISDASGKSIFEGYVAGNQNHQQLTQTTDAPGEYDIIAQKDSISAEKTFEVSELKKINISLDGNVLTITNVGNVVYKDIVEIKIGTEKILKEVNLDIGGKIQYEVSAPDGNYNLEAKSEGGSFSSSGVALTGDAISLNDVKNTITNIWASYPIVWIFLAIVLFLFIWAIYKRWSQEKRFSFLEPSRRMKDYAKKTGGVMVISPGKVDREIDRVLINGEIRKAEHLTVMHGQKTPAAVIAIKVKNDIGGIAENDLEESLEYAYKNKAVSYMSGEYILLIFSPLLTKTGKNEGLAIKAAMDIDNSLKEHNRKYRTNPIAYGIGVNSGDIINKIAGRVLQFTSMGKTITIAKRIADISDSQLLLSKDIREKAGSSFKLDKFAASKSGNMDLFTIKRVVNTEESSKFIDEFVKRNDFSRTNSSDSPRKYL